jgi:hypothetical protein
MKCRFYVGAIFCLLVAATGKAQSVGQVECARAGGFTYLYSSMTTLDIRRTLECGEQVQITGRYDGYFGVRTAKGDVGYVPIDSVLLLKDKVGAPAPLAAAPKPSRERVPYDAPAPAEAAPAVPVGPEFTLKNGTPVRLKLSQTLSSSSAHVGDQVALEVAEDVVVEGLLVIPKGAAATGTVTEAEMKKRIGGHGGKVGVVINSVILGDKEKAAIRGYEQADGANSMTGSVVPLKSGKDVEMPQGTEIKATVDGDMKLKREAFPAVKDAQSASSAAASAVQGSAQPRQ